VNRQEFFGAALPTGRGARLNLAWLGVAMAVAYWLLESLLHEFVFERVPLPDALLGEYDPNELWMRALIALLFVAFGWIADRSLAAERHLKEDAQRLARLLHFADEVKQHVPHGEGAAAPLHRPPAELTASEDGIGRLTRTLWNLSQYLDERFNELYVLLQLTHEINMGLLLDEVLEKAYDSLRAILPYDRLGVALIGEDGDSVRAYWARSECPVIRLGSGYERRLRGSSLQRIMASGEPRILNDLVAYLQANPRSESTRLIVEEGLRSSLTCPLISAGRAIGFMFFSSRNADTYEHVHVEVFKLIAGHLSLVVEKSNLYQQILREKDHSEGLLLNVIPARISARLRAGEQPIADTLPATNILFADIAGFTQFASRNAPDRVLGFLQDVFTRLDGLCDVHGVEKIKTIGDEYMAISGPDGGADLRNLAEFALDALATIGAMRYPDGQPVRMRVGMHCGPVVAGVIGQKKFAYDIWGDAVNTASRMQSYGQPGRIQVTERIRAKLRDEFLFEERGTIEIKGKGLMKTYFLTGRKAAVPGETDQPRGATRRKAA
jgi:class 3 adenylate cyclase